MGSYGIRRRKQVVAPQLPPLTDTHLPLVFDDRRQKKIYDVLSSKAVEIVIQHTQTEGYRCPECRSMILDNGRGTALPPYTCPGCGLGWDEPPGGFPITGMLIKNMLMRLVRMEQWLSHPWTYDPGVTGVKYKWLMEWAKQTDRPAVIATRFKASAARLAEDLDSGREISGDTHPIFRKDILRDWNEGKHQFLVGTIATIGVGLSLERAHYTVCYDQVYSPLQMEQLRHRIHRITSDHPVEVIYPYIPDTSNQVVLEAFTKKWKQMDLVRRFVEIITKETIHGVHEPA